MMTPKEYVIRSFLDFVCRHVPQSEAQLATLGGQGLEAGIWAERGVPSAHGWLIELNRKLGGNLIKNHRYHTHNRLGTFHRILGGLGEKSLIDGFHLDLCGTFTEKVIEDFSPVLPLVLQSRAKCIAITVADQRRNLILERWKDYEYEGALLFGDEGRPIMRLLEAEQRKIPVRKDLPAFMEGFDPLKGAMREFGLMVEIAKLLIVHRRCVPVEVVRYVYVSKIGKRSFRMRTYFFHFEMAKADTSLLSLARAWTSAPLYFCSGDHVSQVGVTAATRGAAQPERKVYMSLTSRLEQIARAVGGDVEADFDSLVADRRKLEDITTAVASVNGHAGKTNGSYTPQKTSASASALSPSARTKKKKWKSLSQREQIEWLFKALELKKRSNGGWGTGQWATLLADDFGQYTESLSGTLRAAMARTSGGHRAGFVQRIKKAFGSNAKQYLERLQHL